MAWKLPTDPEGLAAMAERQKRSTDTVLTILLLVLPLWVLVWSGNLSTGPRLVDDNQIYMLDRQLADDGLLAVASDQVRTRVGDMGRLVPVYLGHKLLQVALLGTNLVAWGIYNGLLGGVTACLLFWFGRLVRLNVFEAFAFALIVVLGEQSVLWWRHLHGEGIGLFLTSAALLCIPMSTRNAEHARLWRTLFVVVAIGAALSKESFILLLPALAFGLMVHTRRIDGGTWRDAVLRNVVPVIVLASVCVVLVGTIALAFDRTHFEYTGWKGFSAVQFAFIAAEFFGGGRFWLVALAASACVAGYRALGNDGALRRRGLEDAGALGVLVGLILVPQFLLYMSSGYSGEGQADYGRFLVPATLGLAVLTVFPVAWVREALLQRGTRANIRPLMVYPMTTAAILLVVLLLRYEAASHEATAFAAESDDIHVFLKGVALHTDEDDTVLFVVGRLSAHGQTRRMSVVLQEYMGLTNPMYYLPVLGNEPPGTFAYRFKGMDDPYVNDIFASTIGRGTELASVDTVILAGDPSVDSEPLFLATSADWFDSERYLRFQNRRGDVAYFKAEALPEHLARYTEFLTQVEVVGSIEGGTVTVRGRITAPEPIGRVALYWGETELASTSEMERAPLPYRVIPKYAGVQARFALEAPWPGGDGAAVVRVYNGDEVLYSGPVEIGRGD